MKYWDSGEIKPQAYSFSQSVSDLRLYQFRVTMDKKEIELERKWPPVYLMEILHLLDRRFVKITQKKPKEKKPN